MKEKKIIRILKYLFHWVFNLNLILGIGMIGFTIINMVRPLKVVSAAYLGKFNVTLPLVSSLHDSQFQGKALFFSSIAGNPEVVMNTWWHGFFIFLYVSALVIITLVYNYQLWRLFHNLDSATNQELFKDEIASRLLFTSKFSFLIFITGLTMSTLKVLFMESFIINGMEVKPVFDNNIINFLWVGITLYIVAQVYKVGLDLKKEQELTI